VPVSLQGSLLAGRYRIIRPLGHGGMATVFLAEDQRLGREVAVKRLHADAADDAAKRFMREARLGAALSHPNLVSVFDTASDDEGVLIVMERVAGESLADALARGPLGSERTLAVVRAVAAALDHAHARGVVHRDVKPANVLLRDDGVVKLVDLGIATATESTRITGSDTLLGTAAYMAPEQLDGRGSSERSDVYGLAALAFEALCGRRAQMGKSPIEVAHRVATEPTPDLRDAWPEAPAEAAEVLRRGMARRPLSRQASAGQLARELEAALHAPARAGRWRAARDARLGAPRRLRSRLPGWAPAVAAALIVAAGIGGGLLAGGAADDQSPERAAPKAAGGAADSGKTEKKRSGTRKPANERPPTNEPAAPAQPTAPPTDSPSSRSQPVSNPPVRSGSELNDEGFSLMQAGRYDEAITLLRQALERLSPGDLTYAYALFNLGRSLRLAGRPEEAIPVLEQRLRIPDQTSTVRRELAAARREAGS
jgi:eukaryotic-like serine/threonine-protein kinase